MAKRRAPDDHRLAMRIGALDYARELANDYERSSPADWPDLLRFAIELRMMGVI